MSKKIFLGLVNICNLAPTLKKAFEELGHTVVLALASQSSLYAKSEYLSVPFLHTGLMRGADIDYRRGFSVPSLLKPVFDCDTFIFIAIRTLFLFQQDLPFLRGMGKKILINAPGSDARHHAQAARLYESCGMSFPEALKNKNRNRERELTKVSALLEDVYTKKVYSTRMAESYADTLISSPGSTGLFLRPYHASPMALDISGCRPFIPKRERPLIVHAPTSRDFKQTDLILQTLETLREEGVAFDLELLEHKRNKEVLRSLTRADVLIDQIYCGKSGALGLEGLASGCCVVGCNHATQPIPYESQPVIGITNANIYERLKQVLTDKKLRTQYAEAGVEYMKLGIHDPVRVAARFLDCLDRSAVDDYDYYPTFYVERGEPAEGEIVPEAIKAMNWDVMRKYGVATDFNPENLFKFKLLPKEVTLEDALALPRWKLDGYERYRWGWRNKTSIYPYGQDMPEEWKQSLSRLKPLAKRFENT